MANGQKVEIKVTCFHGDAERTLALPGHFAVCPKCYGHGTILNPSIGEHAYSVEEFEEAFSTQEQQDAYFHRGGMYDVTCPRCSGQRVVAVLDREALRVHRSGRRILARIEAEERAIGQLELDEAFERRYGC